MAEFIYKKKFIQKILHERRKQRVKFVLAKVDVFSEMSILDIGCGPDGRSLENVLPDDYGITGIDLYEEKDVKIKHPNFTYIQHDATDLSIFKDKQFDLCFSIGMMEHICDRSVLLKMAREIERVSKQYVILVPWKWAWIEPHFKVPFFQLYPYGFKLFITKLLNLHDLGKKVSSDSSYINNHYQWLSNTEWRTIFTNSSVHLMPTCEAIAIIKKNV